MNKNLQDIDKIFTQFLKDYTEEPPPDMWQQIENDLNRRDAEMYKSKYGSLKKTVTCIVLTCACLLLSGALQFFKHNNDETQIAYKSFQSAKKFELHNNKKEYNHDKEKVKQGNAVTKENLNDNTTLSKNTLIASDKIHQDYNQIIPLYNTPNTSNNTQESLLILASGTNINADTITSSVLLSNVLKNRIPLNLIQEKSRGVTKQTITKQKHPFYAIPFATIDHVAERLQQVYEYNNENKSDYSGREKPDMSYTTGLIFEYNLSKKYALQSGLVLSNAFTNVSPTIVKAVPDNSGLYKFKLVTSYGFAEIKKAGMAQQGDSVSIIHAMIHLQYISIPALMKINLKQGKINISGTLGAAFNAIQKDEVEVDYATSSASEIESIGRIEGVKNNFITLMAGAEAAYRINRNISIGVNPVLRYAVTPVNKGTPVKTYPINLGVGASVRIKL